jgi:nucleoid DNA-binding protein
MTWADLVLVMEQKQAVRLAEMFWDIRLPPIECLEIQDDDTVEEEMLTKLIQEGTEARLKSRFGWLRADGCPHSSGSIRIQSATIAAQPMPTENQQEMEPKDALTKRDLVIRIATETKLNQQDVYAVVQKTLDYITEALQMGKHVEFRDFGVFQVVVRKSRIGRNPRKPANVVRIPDRKVVKFKAGRLMKQKILGTFLPAPVASNENDTEIQGYPTANGSGCVKWDDTETGVGWGRSRWC